MEDRRIEDKRIEINRRLREIQDEVALNKKEQACINEIIDEIIDMKHMYASFNEERLAYWDGTEFGREVSELNAERETLYRELIRDAEDGIEERRHAIQTLLKEERECEDELMQMRRDY
ncbi:MAG: hypothetical protein HXM74_04065 [Mogibacterium diversum]|nr:hypothetical protein [Mogibacterium diversum]